MCLLVPFLLFILLISVFYCSIFFFNRKKNLSFMSFIRSLGNLMPQIFRLHFQVRQRLTLPHFRLCYGFEKTFYDSLLRIKNAGLASKFHCPEHYDKPRKARNMEAVASMFLRVLSSLGRGISMPALHFLFQSVFRRVFLNPCRQVIRWQLVVSQTYFAIT